MYAIVFAASVLVSDALPGDALYKLNVFLQAPVLPQALTGGLFGFLMGDWIKYLTNPVNLIDQHVRVAHKRWGFLLLGLVVLGVFSDALDQLITNVRTVPTPFGAINFVPMNSSDTPIVKNIVSSRGENYHSTQ